MWNSHRALRVAAEELQLLCGALAIALAVWQANTMHSTRADAASLWVNTALIGTGMVLIWQGWRTLQRQTGAAHQDAQPA
ncbi:MAG: hypothetical protein HRT77_00110 [Halioglobus sp.]|nr:hypothetical protein [Halioglobus sp.]